MTEPPAPQVSPWRRLVALRTSRSQVVVALLCGLLGFGLVTQARATHASGGLASARQEDLIGILNDLSARADRLRGQLDQLQADQTLLSTSHDQRAAAVAEARSQAATLGILAGTLPAVGPGIVLSITDPGGRVHADVLVDALEELRDAGAEVIQVGPVRVVAATYFLDTPGGISVDGTTLRPPYRFLVIGDPRTLAAALGIPGGVVDTVAAQGGGAHAYVAQTQHVQVSALRPAGAPG